MYGEYGSFYIIYQTAFAHRRQRVHKCSPKQLKFTTRSTEPCSLLMHPNNVVINCVTHIDMN